MLKRKYLIFFDNSYVDLSFKTRLSRQKDQFNDFLEKLKKFFYAKINLVIKIYKNLVARLKIYYKKNKELKFSSNWYPVRSLSSFDYHIQEKGGIVDNMGNVHTTAQSYKNYLKENGLVIKDWSDSSNKPKQQLSDRADIAKIVNKYI